MSYITYLQYDSRWGKKNYNGSSNMATAGCGPTSCADFAYAVDGKTTPIQTMKFMQKNKYAIYNNGTAWSGIPACMEAFKLQDVKDINVDSTMKRVWDYLGNGYCADFLFRAGSRGGVCWTTSGHYVAVTNFRYRDGQHWLYTRDSGGRGHTGWYSYEKHMKGLIPKVWVGNAIPKPQKKTKYKGKYPTTFISKEQGDSSEIEKWQDFLAWWLEDNSFANDGIFGNKTEKATIKFQKAYGLEPDGAVGRETRGMMLLVGKGEKH